mmetsp:Transcript_11836/g.17745  ORF Transcript_11836/g.17745 Transcript_11836/m.17745 type:complete len:81 (+) Transcript_11836:852-1094(+)
MLSISMGRLSFCAWICVQCAVVERVFTCVKGVRVKAWTLDTMARSAVDTTVRTNLFPLQVIFEWFRLLECSDTGQYIYKL